MEVAKALGGSFKLVTPAPKPVRVMTHCSGKHKRMVQYLYGSGRQSDGEQKHNIFSGYNKYYKVTAMLHELDFSDFNTVIGSHQHALHRQILLCDNDVL